jgi:hypothetical protein
MFRSGPGINCSIVHLAESNSGERAQPVSVRSEGMNGDRDIANLSRTWAEPG